MKNLTSWLVLIVIAGVVSAAAPAGQALAAPVSLTVSLTGAQQVPLVQTSGSGTAELTFDPATRAVTWSVTYSGLSSPVTMAHIHGPAGPGKNAGVLVWLTKRGAPGPSPITGKATLTPAQAREFMAGLTYINVHTQDHPAGEIRGQVVLPKS